MSRFLWPLALLLAVSHAVSFENEANTAATEEKPKINYRLPDNVKPESYNIQLVPNLRTFVYSGKSVITVTVLKATKNITMHSKDLEISKAVVTVDKKDIEPKIEQNEITDFLILQLADEIKENTKVVITLEFTGKHNDELRGFYRSSYVNDKGLKRWLATTHFEATSARRAFPCFDEPALKATFDITIDLKDLDSSYKAISNMPVKNLTEKVYQFKTTPSMSTYLVAFVVSDFDVIKDTETKPNSVYTKKDLQTDAKYALEMGKKIITKMAKYVNIPYQLPKMDHVGVPEFTAGAMENWGLIIYRQNSLVYNNDTSTATKKQGVAGIIAHEVAHQWFGDHVGPNWWRDIWLNEGFARFFQSFITDEVEADFKMGDQFVVANLQGTAFAFDVTDDTHPMNVDVESPTEIAKIFDSISYDKSACVIRMMQHFLTEGTFKDGLSNYLNAKKNLAATSDDLFKNINDKWTQDNKTTKLTLDVIMNHWVNQPGYPVITVKRNYDKKSAEISQQRFMLKQSKEPKTENWTIPINFAVEAKAEENFKTTEASHWFEFDKKSLTVNEIADAKNWVIFNKKQTGYYRVNYDNDNWRLIINYLLKKENINKIDALNRAQLVDDAWNLARAGLLSYDIAFDLTSYLESETDYFPWYSAIRNLNYIKKLLMHTNDFENFKKFGLKISTELIKNVGLQHNSSDTHIQILKRNLAMNWACSMGYKECPTEYEKMFNSWMEDAQKNTINPNLKGIVLCEGIKNANQTIWDALFKRFEQEKDEDQKSVMTKALGCSKNEKILANYLGLAVQKESKIDLSSAISSVIDGSDVGLNVSMKFVFRNKTAILEHDKGDVKNLLRYIKEIGNRISLQEQADNFQLYLKEDEALDKKEINSAIEKAKDNIEWMKKYGNTITSLLVEKTKENSAHSLKFAAISCLIPIVIALLI